MVLKAKKSRRSSQGKEDAIAEAQKQEVKRLNLDIPVNLHRQLKSKAAAEGMTMREVVQSAIEVYLSK